MHVKNEYTVDDISRLISQTVLEYVNKNMHEKKYTIKEVMGIFESANVMDFYFVNDYSKPNGDPVRDGEVSSTRFYKFVENLNNIREHLTVEEYCSFLRTTGLSETFIQLPKATSFFYESNLNNYYLDLVEKVIEQRSEEVFINFVKFVVEAFHKNFDKHNCPTLKEWDDAVMDENIDFDVPPSILFPLIVSSYSDEKKDPPKSLLNTDKEYNIMF